MNHKGVYRIAPATPGLLTKPNGEGQTNVQTEIRKGRSSEDYSLESKGGR